MDYVVMFILGMATAGLILKWTIRRAIDRIMAQMDQEDQKAAASQRLELRVELDKNTYFCYNIADGTFVCQGTDLTELQQNFRRRFPETNGVIVEGDDASITWLKTEMNKSNENSSSIRPTP